jgi:hypothetical protein
VDRKAMVPPAGPRLDRVFVVMMENTNYADVVDAAGRVRADRMPWLAAAAREGLTHTAMWANYHPSDQNYIAMVAGDTFVPGPRYFPGISIDQDHLGDRLEAAGLSWRAYVQGMGSPCRLEVDAPVSGGHYAPDDQPFVHFRSVRGDAARCTAHLRDLSDLAQDARDGTLPAFAWIAADGWWDGEGAWEDSLDVATSLRRQDEFLRDTLGPLLASPAWNHDRALLVLTWDESLGWGWPDNRIPTVLLGSAPLGLTQGIDDHHYDGYDVLRTIEDGLGLQGLDRFDAFARPLALGPDALRGGGSALEAGEIASTTGSVAETYGQTLGPVSVVQGEALALRQAARPRARIRAVTIAPWQRGPGPQDPVLPMPEASLSLAVDTGAMAPGIYGAWADVEGEGHSQAPLPLQVLPVSPVDARHPGVALRGADAREEGEVRLRQGGNLVVHYCRPAGVLARQAWIAVYPAGEIAKVRSRPGKSSPGEWSAAPGSTPDTACGDAVVHTAERPPAAGLQVQMFVDDATGVARRVGRRLSLRITPTLPAGAPPP